MASHPLPAAPPYRFAVLAPARHLAAAGNWALLGPTTLGIEVTDPELACQCGLGNLDPQHGVGATAGVAAIEAALLHPLPPDGAILATLRPDSDAIGAMAVLHLRRLGVTLLGPRLRRIRQIAKWDMFDLGSWQAWQLRHPPLPRPAGAAALGGPPPAIAMLAALAADHARPVAERAEAIARHIADGTPDRGAQDTARRFRAGLLAAWNAGAIAIHAAPDPRIAVVQGAHPGALRLGYRHAPVVVAEGAVEGRRKLTIAQFEPGWADFGRLACALAAREPGWGGSATIFGSPQGSASTLPLDQVIAELLSCLERRGG